MTRGLARVAALYGKVEQMKGLELRLALGAVAEVEVCRAQAEGQVRGFGAEMQGALLAGDGVGRACAEAMRDCTEGRVERLAEMQREREKAAAEAAEAHRESRMKTEQIERVVERVRQAQALLAGRREQAGADDRYAARAAYERSRVAGEKMKRR